MDKEPYISIMARKEREQKLKAIEHLTDAERSSVSLLHDQWSQNGHYFVGDVCRRGGVLYKCLTEHDAQIAWKPEYAPSLWTQIMYKDGIRIIPEVIEATAPFMHNELGWWGDDLYKSLVDYNIYTPVQYSRNWEREVK